MVQPTKALWPTPIPILGATGKYMSGKSIFVNSLCHPKYTRAYDLEKSTATYKDLVDLGLDRVDVPNKMLDLYGDDGFTNLELFKWWLADTKAIKAGQFKVVSIDPIDELEAGLVDWVKSQYARYNFSSGDSFYKTGGIFWNNVRKEWKRILLDLATRVETVAFTAHLKQVWRHGKPTDELVPKGKSTLLEVASLYLFLERDVLGQGEERDFNQKPSAIVLKTRLGSQTWSDVDDELVTTPLLPPRLPVATPRSIREYLLSPPDYNTLTDAEKVMEKELSSAAKLLLQADIAEQNRMAAEAQKETASLELVKEDNRRSAMAAFRPAPDQTQAVQATLAKQRVANMEELGRKAEEAALGTDAPADGLLTKNEVEHLLKLSEAKGAKDAVKESLRRALGITRVTIGAVRKLPRDKYSKLMAWVESK